MTSCDTFSVSESDLGSSLGGRVSDEDRFCESNTSKPLPEADVTGVRPEPPLIPASYRIDCRP